MSENKLKFIKEQIERSGFPLELDIASILYDYKWDITSSPLYQDEDEDKWRETDMIARKTITDTPDGKRIAPYYLSLNLIVECKRTTKYAWVFFLLPTHYEKWWWQKMGRAPKYLDFLTIARHQSVLKEDVIKKGSFSSAGVRRLGIDPDLLKFDSVIAPEVARKLPPFSKFRLITTKTFSFFATQNPALSYTEVKLTKDGGGSGSHEIFEAMNSLIKATKYNMILGSSIVFRMMAESVEKQYQNGLFDIKLYLPLIILEGELYRWVDGRIEEASKVLLKGRCHTKNYSDEMYIAVVKKSEFKNFLNDVEEDCMNLSKRLWQKRDQLKQQVKVIMNSPPLGHNYSNVV